MVAFKTNLLLYGHKSLLIKHGYPLSTPRRPIETVLNSTDVFVGEKLRARRLAMKMSQTELGAVADISFQQIQKYERGTNRISISMLHKFADALKAPIQFFLPEDNYTSGLASGQKQALYEPPPKDAQELLNLYNTLTDPRLKKQVLQLTRALVESQKETSALVKRK